MNKQSKLLCSLVSTVLLLSMTQAVSADANTEQNDTVNEFVVTANRIPLKPTETAAKVTVITREEIEKGGYTSVPDILKHSDVNLQQNNFSSVLQLNGDDRVLILVDGRRMNWQHLVISGNDYAGMNLNLLPVSNIERIEIVRGAASSLYGSDAVGGVINIITRKADTVQTAVNAEFGSWGSRRYNLRTEGAEGSISYLLTAEHSKQDNFEYKDAASGTVKTHPDSQFDRKLYSLRLDKELSGDRSLSLQVERMEDEFGFGGYIKTDGSVAYPGGYAVTTDNNLALTYQWSRDTGSENSLRVYHNQSEGNYYNSLAGFYDLEATGANWQQSWKLNSSHTLVGGTEWRQDRLNDGASIDKSHTTTALFAENRWELPSNWTLSLGARYDDHNVIGGRATSRVSVNREINATTNIYTSWGQYVKNPTMAQLFSNTEFWKGNPDLRPETGQTVTVGMNTELAGLKLSATAYQSRIEDALDWEWKDWEGTGTSYTKYINVNREKRQGFDLNLSRQLSSQWSASAGYSYVQIQRKEDAADYASDPRNSQPNGYRLNLGYDQDKWSGGLTLKSATGRDLSAFTSRSYLTVDMTVNYQMDPDTRLYVKGYNLTNRSYELLGTIWSGLPGDYPMPARSIYAGLEHKI
ncbi:TonB-dependent receptor plug domain-containing protein [Acetonema longum]|uniref:TonB-dependent receptor n=1 Tax=Acetonema longum DSM 6540 TaxID=1009370 RepID=F7NEU1_9FIRM|nr:TonB-dependent receptor [Acetonema longum]EGO65502.1 TonB-dependent receptor [Acetonema longum DSM 6540]